MIDEYTRLLKVVAEAPDETTALDAVHKLVAHLKSTGRMKMLPQIARELKKIAARRIALMPKLEVASEKEAHAALTHAKKAGFAVHKAVVNHSLVRGWRARSVDALLDRSGKGALIDIYKNVIR